jgi:hypothetical protein
VQEEKVEFFLARIFREHCSYSERTTSTMEARPLKTKLFLTLIAFAALSFPTSKTSACSCATFSPCEAFNYASTVFVGRMIEGTEKVMGGSKGGKTVAYEAGRVRLTVEEAFKNVATAEMTVMVPHTPMCSGMLFVRGEKYLVYANESDAELIVRVCSATKLYEDAKEDLEFLRNLPQPGVGGKIFGQVRLDSDAEEPPGLAEVEVLVENKEHQLTEVRTGIDGKYEINGLIAGKYIVSPNPPNHYRIADGRSQQHELDLTDRGCAQASFFIEADGRINGWVRDSTGRPAPSELTLSAFDQAQKTFRSATDDNGQYTMEGIPPGRYLLRLTLRNDEGKEEQFFYPGTKDESKAAVIKLDMAESISGYGFQLPEGLQIKTVKGIVTYPDGRAADHAQVRLLPARGTKSGAYRANIIYAGTTTDDQGRFMLSGYKDVIYRIVVVDDSMRASEEKRRPGTAQLENVVLKEDLDGIKVVLPLQSNPEKQSPKK